MPRTAQPRPPIDPTSYLARMKRLVDYENYGDYGRKMAQAEGGPGPLADQQYRVGPTGDLVYAGGALPGEKTVPYAELSDEQKAWVKRDAGAMTDAFGLMPGEGVSGMPWNTELLGSEMAGYARSPENPLAMFSEGQARDFASSFGKVQEEQQGQGYNQGRALLDAIRQRTTNYRRY